MRSARASAEEFQVEVQDSRSRKRTVEGGDGIDIGNDDHETARLLITKYLYRLSSRPKFPL